MNTLLFEGGEWHFEALCFIQVELSMPQSPALSFDVVWIRREAQGLHPTDTRSESLGSYFHMQLDALCGRVSLYSQI